MKKFKKLSFLFGLLTFELFYAHGYAALNVIADHGGESAVRFYEGIQPVHDENAEKHPNAVPHSLHEADLLPIRSHLMRPGKVTPRQFNISSMQPLFLVGADPLSKQWLKQNKDFLIKIKAQGIIVNVDSLNELHSMRAIAGELPLYPVSSDDLAQRLNLSYYPVIISATGVSQ